MESVRWHVARLPGAFVDTLLIIKSPKASSNIHVDVQSSLRHDRIYLALFDRIAKQN